MDNNGTVDQTTDFSYTGTQQTSKQVFDNSTSVVTQSTTYGYNLQGRMADVTIENFDGSGTLSNREALHYEYDPSGIRVAALDEIDSDGNGTFDSRTLTEYLIDARNDTGYQQVLQENVTDADTGAEIKRVVYTLGLDHIAQTTFTPGGPAEGTTLVFHTDGHGSVRVLTDLAAAIATVAAVQQIFHYDAYGNALGFNPATAATTHLYSGEQFDAATGLGYNRARYYNPATATWNRLDPFTGNLSDPQTLHKYLYTHGDPINAIDPTGREFSIGGLVTAMGVGAIVGGLVGGGIAKATGHSFWKGFLYGAAIGALVFGLIYAGAWAFGLHGIGRFFFNPRAFSTISRQYWARYGPAAGRSLHHWLIPQRWTWIPQGIRNAGFNLLRLPKVLPGSLGLNQWLGFAIRWGGYRRVVAFLVENGIRILIPASIFGGAYSGAWLGNEDHDNAVDLPDGAQAVPLKLNPDERRQFENKLADDLIAELNHAN